MENNLKITPNVLNVEKGNTTRPYPIVCTEEFTLEGLTIKEGTIKYHSFGRNIPKRWRKATEKDLENARQ